MGEAAARNAALRAICADGRVNFARLGAISGRSARGIAAQAKREGWAMLAGLFGGGTRHVRREEAAPEDAHITALKRMIEQASRMMERVGASGGPVSLKSEKERIQLMTAAARAVEKAADLIERDTKKNKDDGDEEDIAEVFRRVDRRIEDLARAYAKKLVAEMDDGAAGQDRWQRVVHRRAD